MSVRRDRLPSNLPARKAIAWINVVISNIAVVLVCVMYWINNRKYKYICVLHIP